MHRCEDCKIILDNDVRYCPKCGKDIASDSGSAPDPIMDVPRLLAAANLHKYRSEWDEAISAATDALRLEPRSADVTIMLGSIYEERGMLDEALVWYQMALEIDPSSGKAKAGRDRVGMLISARRKEAAATPTPDPAKRAKLYGIGIAAGIVLIILALVTALALKGDHPSKRTTGTSASSRPSLSPPISQAWARRSSTPRPAAPPLSGATAAPTQSSATTLRTKAEESIRTGLSSAQAITETGASVDDVIADPRAAVATVTFSLSARGIVTKDQITRAAVAIAKQTFELHQAVRFVTARCVIQVPGSDGAQVAFIADIAREAVTPTATDQQLAAAFTHPWWNPQIR